MQIITDTNALTHYCATARNAEFLCVDTEFMRESTFYSQLCLIQVATPDSETIIDPLADGIDLTGFMDLLFDPNIVKVMHSARQDVEIFYDIAQKVVRPLFDTQIAAMALGFGDSVGYTSLVKGRLDVNLDKGARFTDWSRRPLTERQLQYAINDVTYLRDMYPGIRDELAERGRTSWVEEETEPMLAEKLYRNDPDSAWERLKIRSPKKPYLAALRAAAAWREREAISRNIPRRRVLKDDALYAIAGAQPTTQAALGKVRGVPKGFERSKSAKSLVKAVETAMGDIDNYAPKVPKPKHRPPNLGPTVEMLRTLLRLKTEYEDIAPRLIANASDIEEIAARGEKADIPAMKGWRREVFGNDALALLDGDIALRLKGREVVAERL